MTIQDLKDLGFHTKVRHTRNIREVPKLDGVQKQLRSKGGMTEVGIYKGDTLLSTGWAKCCSIDNYNRKLGLKIALGRAIKKMDVVSLPNAIDIGTEAIMQKLGQTT